MSKEKTEKKAAKVKEPKQPREKSDGKRCTIWLSETLRKEVVSAFGKEKSFSEVVQDGLKLMLKKS